MFPTKLSFFQHFIIRLERRFLERVTQTNRAKSSNVGGNSTTSGSSNGTAPTSMSSKAKADSEEKESSPPTPPWLRPPKGYTHGSGAATAAASLSGVSIDRSASAAAAGRALLQGSGTNGGLKSSVDQNKKRTLGSSSSHGSAGLLALAALQQRKSQQSLLNLLSGRTSAANLLAAAASSSKSNANSSVSGSALAQIARNASAARLAGLAASGNSMTNLMLKAGISRDQLNALARENSNSSKSLSNMLERQSSFDALMSLDFQSLQSIDNLANLIQSGSGANDNVPRSGMKNWSGDSHVTSSNNAESAPAPQKTSSGNLTSLSSLRRLASEGRMESLIRSLSSGNVSNKINNGSSNANFSNLLQSIQNSGSNSNFNSLLQSMQSNLNGTNNSSNSLFGSGE